MGWFDFFNKKAQFIDELQYGDIVWCKIDEAKKYNFEDKHKMRPCTVLYKDDDYVYVFTHSHYKKENNISHYLGERLGGSILTNEVIKVKHKDCKSKFEVQYNRNELNNLTKYLYHLHKQDEMLATFLKQHISYFPGDLVMVDGEKYLIKKTMESHVSLVKYVSKGKHGIPFKYKDEQYLLSKDAIVCEKDKLDYVCSYGNGIIDAFEEAKKNKAIKVKEAKKEITYKIGDILLIGEEERLVIDIYNDDLILLDSDNKCSCESKSKRFEILENIGVKEVNKFKRVIDYSDMKRSNILLCKSKR